jgi:hypothetical protein
VPTVRVMFVGQGASLLPEDRFVNVFHFHDPTLLPPGPAVDACLDVVEDCYTGSISGGNSMGTFFSPYMMRAATLIGYDLLSPEPRTPVPRAITLGGAQGEGLPEEVALVLSTHGAPPITARRRGRVYFGPLTNGVSTVVDGSNTTPSRPAQASAGQLVQAAVAFGTKMVTDSAVIGMPWCIRSTVPSENFVPITGGFVDNAWDTQRRRGPTTTARTLWGS